MGIKLPSLKDVLNREEDERITRLISIQLEKRRSEMNLPMRPFAITGDRTGKGNNQFTVSLGSVTLHFSYETLVGIHVWDGNDHTGQLVPVKSYRVENTWGRTTGKHMNQMGLERAKVVTPEELQEIVRGALFADVVKAPLNQGDRL